MANHFNRALKLDFNNLLQILIGMYARDYVRIVYVHFIRSYTDIYNVAFLSCLHASSIWQFKRKIK